MRESPKNCVTVGERLLIKHLIVILLHFFIKPFQLRRLLPRVSGLVTPRQSFHTELLPRARESMYKEKEIVWGKGIRN